MIVDWGVIGFSRIKIDFTFSDKVNAYHRYASEYKLWMLYAMHNYLFWTCATFFNQHQDLAIFAEKHFG
mgnify:CR=1 FL=1